MAVEALLPSEIARLVYGYLVEENCSEAAKTFLNESPNLYECRSLVQRGRIFTTRACGLTLLDILEKFVALNCIVQDQLAVFDKTQKLKYCSDIVPQIKFLLEECRAQPAASNNNETAQSGHAAAAVTPSKGHKKRHSGKNENGLSLALQSDDGYQTETPPDSNSLQNIPSIEATPLEHLPGYVESLHSKKSETSWPKVVQTPTKVQQIKENVRSQVVQTSETQKICQVTRIERTVLSQEVQTSFKLMEANSIQNVPNENHEKTSDNATRLNNHIAVTSVEDKISNGFDPKAATSETGLCNNLENCRNQEVINLDDSEEQISLEPPTAVDPSSKVSEACIEILEDVQSGLLSSTEMQEKIASNINKLMEPIKSSCQSQSSQGSSNDGSDFSLNDLHKIIGTAVDMTENDPMFVELLNSVVRLDEHVSSSEEVEMDIDNENPSSEENISNDDAIMEENNQCDPEIIDIDSMSTSPIHQNVQPVKTPEMTNKVVISEDIVIPDSQIPPHSIPNNAAQEKCLFNSVEPSLFDKNFQNPPEFPDHNTSTPLKLFTATQNCDNNEWFSTQSLPSSIVPMTNTLAGTGNFPYAQMATESIVSPVDGFISPIICKENTKVAEKISLNCNGKKVDDTLHTPDVPPMTKSFIPTLPAPPPPANVPPKDKTPVLSKNPEGENASPSVPATQDTLPSFNSISSLVRDTEFNRYFSIREIDVENPVVGVSGTGLSLFLQKKNEGESQKSSETSDKVEENAKVDEASVKVSDVAITNASDEKSEKTDDAETNGIEQTSSQAANVITAQTIVNEAKESLEAVTTEVIDDGDDMDITCESVHSNVVDSEENVDSIAKALASETGDKVDDKPEEDEKETVEIAEGEAIETDECRKEKSEDAASKVHEKMNVSTESAKQSETKSQTGTIKKESLKSILSKKFESYIDPTKDNIASNHNETRKTPKAVEERAKRRSLSTPKKSSSHIRALTFETPIQSRSDSKINDQTRCASPETAKRNLKRLHESFQSPPVGDCEVDNQVQGSGEVSTTAVNEKENVDNENITDTVDKLSQKNETKKDSSKKNWDSDLRMLVGPASAMPKVVEVPRNYKTKSREGSSSKKKKRDKSKTPRKEKKSDKSPHKKSKKSEKEKTPKKSHKRDKSRERRDDKKSKVVDKLTAKVCKDLGAQIESNLLSDKENKLSAKECKDISARIESNLLSSKAEIKKKSDDKLSAKERKDISAKIESNLLSSKGKKVESKKVDEKSSARDKSAKVENNSTQINNKSVKTNIKDAKKAVPSTENKGSKNEAKEAHSKGETIKKNEASTTKVEVSSKKEVTKPNSTEKMITEPENNLIPREPTQAVKPTSKKDPLEYLLSDSVNEDDDDCMELDDIVSHQEPPNLANKPVDRETAEKMQQDEEAIAAVLEEANHAINEKYKAAEKQRDFFPETSLMTDEEEHEDVASGEKKMEEKNESLQESAEPEKEAEKTPTLPPKPPVVDYDSIEQQLGILTASEPPSARKVIYDQVSKVEDGKVVKKKYARLQTLDTKKPVVAANYETVIDSTGKEDSLEMPPTPQIADPGSNSWVPNPSILIKEDSRTVHSSVPTPLECPPTPKIFITPQKEETVDAVQRKVETVPYYHLTPITFGSAKKVTEFEVVKETLKKTTPVEKKEAEGRRTPSSRDKSASRMDSEDSDSSSSSDSSDSSSSSSSSDEDDDCSRRPLELAKTKEVSKPETRVDLLIENEEVVIGNEIIFVEHEEVVVAAESSPAKVFPIHKSDKELEETVNETPAKDENAIEEEGIFETPNVSKPVDNPTNLHAKISQMMILKEQEEMRRLESQRVAEPKKDGVKIAEKSEAEVAKAIESIAGEKFDKSVEEANSSVGSSKAPEVIGDKVKKRELSKAIQSITKEDDDSSDSSSDDSSSSSDDEQNFQLVEPNEDAVDESLGLDNSQHHAEFHEVFDEANYKKRRRKQFCDEEMSFEPEDEDGNMLCKIKPTSVDILFNLIPPKKKKGPNKKVKDEEEEEFDDGDSSEDFVPSKNARGGTKRRRSGDEPKSRKRHKNIFIF